jgi:hypothetical protein
MSKSGLGKAIQNRL